MEKPLTGCETWNSGSRQKLTTSGMKKPHLAAVLVGNDGGSETYVAAKIKACEEVGFKSHLLDLMRCERTRAA